ncbi:MAG: biotin/lipoyl-containing protein, partial [Candidatus Rokuibacteriota bacterium]
MTTDVRIPQLGESVTEGTIARWLKQDGDVVNAEEPVLELETDKATMEIPAGTSGRLEILEPQGAVVRVGTPVARITVAEAGAARAVKTVAPAAPPQPSTPTPTATAPAPAGEPALSPAVRKLVAEHALDPAQVSGTGKGGRLTKGDVLRHLERPAPAPAGDPAA